MDSPLLNQSSGRVSWKTVFFNHNWRDSSSKLMFFCRSAVALTGLLVCTVNALTGFALPNDNISCMWDALHWATQPANDYFLENMEARNILIISSSLLIDLLLLNFIVRFSLWGNTWRPIMSMMSFYMLRMFCQGIFYMEFPEGNNWSYPGFPSLFVPYVKSSDFFYSGHVGIVTLMMLDNLAWKNYFCAALSAFSICFESVVMTILRTHYSIDLVAGVIFAHYIWIMLEKPAKWVDKLSGFSKNR